MLPTTIDLHSSAIWPNESVIWLNAHSLVTLTGLNTLMLMSLAAITVPFVNYGYLTYHLFKFLMAFHVLFYILQILSFQFHLAYFSV